MATVLSANLERKGKAKPFEAWRVKKIPLIVRSHGGRGDELCRALVAREVAPVLYVQGDRNVLGLVGQKDAPEMKNNTLAGLKEDIIVS